MTRPGESPSVYRKRPVEVVAIRWTGRNWPEVAGFVASVPSPSLDGPAVRQASSGRLALWIEKSQTWRPDHPVGDWIIAERDGVGVYPCVASEFDETYEEIEDG